MLIFFLGGVVFGDEQKCCISLQNKTGESVNNYEAVSHVTLNGI